MRVPAPLVKCEPASEHHLCLTGGVATGSAPAGTISATMSNRDGRFTLVQLTWSSTEDLTHSLVKFVNRKLDKRVVSL